MQNTPGDATAACLAGLQSTEQVLTAVRKAGAARSRILSGQGHVAHEQLPLTGLSSVRQLQHQRWRPASCDNLQLSGCGNWLAASLSAMQADRPGERRQRCFYEVAVYSVPGFQLQTVLGCGTSACNMHWAPQAAHLSLALKPFPRDMRPGAVAPQVPAACIVDAETGAVLSSLSAETIKAAVALAAQPGSYARTLYDAGYPWWSPCGTRFLVEQKTQWGQERGASAGVLRVYDVVQDQQLLETRYVCEDGDAYPASWHPSLMAVLLEPGVLVPKPAAFAEAGLALGWLPDPPQLGLSSPGFSADGRLYCAQTYQRVLGGFGAREKYDLLAGSQQDQSIVFTPVYAFSGQAFQWASSGCLAVVYQSISRTSDASSASLRDLAAQTELCCLDSLPAGVVCKYMYCPDLSPSHHFVGDTTAGHARILCVNTGVQLWRGPSDASRTEHLALPEGLQDSASWELWWLPSGRGVICAGRARSGANFLHCFLFS